MNPIVRYMIVCEDWGTDPANTNRINVYGLLSNVYSHEDPPYPLLVEELCVLVLLTETRGSGEAQIICVREETGQRTFATSPRPCAFSNDPLAIIGVPFRIRDCTFPAPGVYLIQFWYNDEMLEQRPLRLR
jgi:hypothetical protein